jgi:hypothetical protein
VPCWLLGLITQSRLLTRYRAVLGTTLTREMRPTRRTRLKTAVVSKRGLPVILPEFRPLRRREVKPVVKPRSIPHHHHSFPYRQGWTACPFSHRFQAGHPCHLRLTSLTECRMACLQALREVGTRAWLLLAQYLRRLLPTLTTTTLIGPGRIRRPLCPLAVVARHLLVAHRVHLGQYTLPPPTRLWRTLLNADYCLYAAQGRTRQGLSAIGCPAANSSSSTSCPSMTIYVPIIRRTTKPGAAAGKDALTTSRMSVAIVVSLYPRRD